MSVIEQQTEAAGRAVQRQLDETEAQLSDVKILLQEACRYLATYPFLDGIGQDLVRRIHTVTETEGKAS